MPLCGKLRAFPACFGSALASEYAVVGRRFDVSGGNKWRRGNIAAIRAGGGRIVGRRPHPGRHFDRILGSDDGRRVFESAMQKIAA